MRIVSNNKVLWAMMCGIGVFALNTIHTSISSNLLISRQIKEQLTDLDLKFVKTLKHLKNIQQNYVDLKQLFRGANAQGGKVSKKVLWTQIVLHDSVAVQPALNGLFRTVQYYAGAEFHDIVDEYAECNPYVPWEGTKLIELRSKIKDLNQESDSEILWAASELERHFDELKQAVKRKKENKGNSGNSNLRDRGKIESFIKSISSPLRKLKDRIDPNQKSFSTLLSSEKAKIELVDGIFSVSPGNDANALAVCIDEFIYPEQLEQLPPPATVRVEEVMILDGVVDLNLFRNGVVVDTLIERSQLFGGDLAAAWSPDSLKRTLIGHAPVIHEIYKYALQQNKSIRGKLGLRLEIAPEGFVVDVQIVENETTDAISEDMQRQIKAKATRWNDFQQVQPKVGNAKVLFWYIFDNSQLFAIGGSGNKKN